MLNITEVRVKKVERGNTLGIASVLIDDCFLIHGIELHEGENGKYILMPINGKIKKVIKNSAFPINEETRKQLLDLIIEKYEEQE